VPNRDWEKRRRPASAGAQAKAAPTSHSNCSFPLASGAGLLSPWAAAGCEFTTVAQRDPEYDDKVGQRLDGRDLVAEWKQSHAGGAYVWNRSQLLEASEAPALLGLFEDDHMQFEHERKQAPHAEPSLTELTLAAIHTLSRSREGYVADGGRLRASTTPTITATPTARWTRPISMSDAVRAAMQATSAEDTLILVTADHSHTLNLVGYPCARQSDPGQGAWHKQRRRTCPGTWRATRADRCSPP
jgi:alkaline phosphatase